MQGKGSISGIKGFQTISRLGEECGLEDFLLGLSSLPIRVSRRPPSSHLPPAMAAMRFAFVSFVLFALGAPSFGLEAPAECATDSRASALLQKETFARRVEEDQGLYEDLGETGPQPRPGGPGGGGGPLRGPS